MAADLRTALRNVPIFQEETGSAFRNHLTDFKIWAAINGLEEHPHLKMCLFYSIRGTARDRMATVDLNSTIYQQSNYSTYEAEVKSIFYPSGEKALNRAAFESYVQGPREDITRYISRKTTLYQEASVDTSANFDYFLGQMIKGLYSPIIKRLVRRSEPRNPSELSAKILAAVAAERQAFIDGYSECQTLDGLYTVERTEEMNLRQPAVHDEPMDVSMLQKQNVQCHICKKYGHYARECRNAKVATDRNSRNGQNHQKQNNQRNRQREKTCHFCGKPGHIQKNCFKKNKEQQKRKPATVHQLEEDSTEMSEEEFRRLTDSVHCMQIASNQDFLQGRW